MAEAFLVRADLVDIDVIKPGIDVTLDLRQMPGGVGSTHNHLGYILLAYHLDGLFKMRWGRQYLRQFAFEPGIRPVLECRTAGAGFVRCPADSQLTVARLVIPSGGCKALNQLLLRGRATQAVAEAAGCLGHLGAAGGNDNGRQLIWQRIDARILHHVVVPTICLGIAGPEQPNDLAGLPLLHSRYNRLPENNWTGNNWSRMTNPQFDALIDRWQATIPRTERMQVLGEILYQISDLLNVMPLIYGIRPIAISNRVQGVVIGSSADVSQAWNVQTWDVR